MQISTEVMGPDLGEMAQKVNPKRIHEAAQQFESILMTQLLKGLHTDGESFMGAGTDAGSSTAMEMAEGELAKSLSAKGGMGLSGMIEKNLTRQASEPPIGSRNIATSQPRSALPIGLREQARS